MSPSRSLKPIVILLCFSWLIPLLVIIVFNLIASLVYKYVYNYSPSFIYSDVLENYDMCFIKNLGSYLLGCCAPASLLFIASLIILATIWVYIRSRLGMLAGSIVHLIGGNRSNNHVLYSSAEYNLKVWQC